jgi:preprotein translocase subunit SecF
LGAELARKGMMALGLSVLFIIIYIAFAFRAVSRPVSSWKYGLIAIAALIHDVVIPTGVFAILGHFYGVEIDSLFLTALLTIFGLSISDTIVVFDRIRENLKKHRTEPFAETVGKSLEETFVRSLNTSLTVILALLALLLFGGQPTRYFALALTIGMIVGTYSSIFIASPLLVVWGKRSIPSKK